MADQSITQAQIDNARTVFNENQAARETANSTLKALAAWSGAITGILGITSVLGVSLDAGSIGEIARGDLETVTYFGLGALILAIIGTAIATVANAIWNSPPGSESIEGYDVAAIQTHFRIQFDHKKLALLASILFISLAILAASCALKTAALAEPAPITEGNRLMAVDVVGTPSTLCGSLEIGDDGQVLFRSAGAAEATPVSDMEDVTKTSSCDNED